MHYVPRCLRCTKLGMQNVPDPCQCTPAQLAEFSEHGFKIMQRNYHDVPALNPYKVTVAEAKKLLLAQGYTIINPTKRKRK